MLDLTKMPPGLPRDYMDLTLEGQRLARIALVSDRSSPEAFVVGWNFFRNHYLMHEDAFFYDDLKEPSEYHFEWAYNRIAYDFNLLAAFRGAAKTTICVHEFPLMDICTMPGSKTMMVASTEKKVEGHFDKIMQQLRNNPRILEDFGNLREAKGEGIWNRSHMRLKNRAELKGFGITSDGMRGERPHIIYVDDPEYDPKAGTNLERLAADMETVLFSVLLPMLRRGRKIFWIGTPITKKLFLWRMLKGEVKGTEDHLWNKKLYPLLNESGTIMWPGEYDAEWVERRRQQLGNKFTAEMMCEPGADEMHPLELNVERNGYTSPSKELADRNDPLNSGHVIEWHDHIQQADMSVIKKPRREIAGDVFRGLRRAVLVDYAPTTNKTSDRSAIHVMGLDRYNQLWSLDLWSGRERSTDLINRIWETAMKWQVRVVAIEAIALQNEFAQKVQDAGDALRMRGVQMVPQMYPIKHENVRMVPKEARIMSAVEWRLRRGLLKLPFDARINQDTAYDRLFWQIDGFTESGAGLDHDDELDTISFAPEVFGRVPQREEVGAPVTIKEYLDRGIRELAPGIPIGTAVPLGAITRDVLLALADLHKGAKGPNADIEWSAAI